MAFSVSTYIALLEEMTRGAQRLERALVTERDGMTQHDNENAKANLTEKLKALKALEGNIDARRQMLSDAGLPQDAKGHAVLLKKLPPAHAEKIDEAAKIAEAAIEACQDLNQGNAQILQRLQQKAEAIKSVISGGDGQRLYGAKGYAKAGDKGRRLGEA